MEKYLVPLQESSPPPPKSLCGSQWKRSEMELTGKFHPKYRHHLSSLLLQSYSKAGAFEHFYHIDGVPCPTHIDMAGGDLMSSDPQFPFTKRGISALEFDSKGIYLASVTKAGCLTVHDFEILYSQTIDSSSCLKEDENKHVIHFSLGQPLDSVRWNLANQDEVACTSNKCNEVIIFDIGYISCEPVQVLRTRRAVTVHGMTIQNGLTDIAFAAPDESRLFASDTIGTINVWDRRTGSLPCLELLSDSRCNLNSIQLNVETQMVFGAGRNGMIYMWDIRGGKASSGFQSHKEVGHPPVTSWKLASMLEKIGSLKAQSAISSKEIHSIDFNPCCPYQLAFHLDDGWSGVLDVYGFKITHVHCPPPVWLNGPNVSIDVLRFIRRPSWLPTYSVYVVGSASGDGIHLLDFYPDTSSPCHVDFREDIDIRSGVKANQSKQNRFVPFSGGVTACATHPLNGTIVAGTQDASLVMVSHHKISGDILTEQ